MAITLAFSTQVPFLSYNSHCHTSTQRAREERRLWGRPAGVRPSAVPPQGVSPNTRFVDLMAEFRDNPRRTPSHSPTPLSAGQRRRVRRRDQCRLLPRSPHDLRHSRAHSGRTIVLHSARHILTGFPLVLIFRDRILQGASFCYLFWTVKGASALALFLLCSNSLLHPLPSRPDPP